MSDPWTPPPDAPQPYGPPTPAAVPPPTFGSAPPAAFGSPAPQFGSAPPPPFGSAPPPPFGSPPPGYAPPASTQGNGFAIAGFVLALLGGIPLGIIFSIIGLVRSRSRGGKGKGFAIAGLVMSALWILIFVIGIVAYASSRAGRDSTGTVVNPGKVDVTSLKVGDCVQLPTSAQFEAKELTAVPCAQSHNGEVYANQTLGLTGSYPGETAVTKAAEAACVTAFEPFVGISYDDSNLDVTYLYPREAQWRLGDRGVTCVVTPGNGSTTGSLKGSGR